MIPATAFGQTRAYELVSPVDKAGADVDYDGPAYASESGDAVTYKTLGTFDQTNSGAVFGNQLLSKRSPSAWATQGINAPIDLFANIGVDLGTYEAFSPDLSKGIAYSWAAKGFGGAEGWNLFMRDDSTSSFDLLSRPVNPIPDADPSFARPSDTRFSAATPDFGRVVFVSNRALTPDSPPEDDPNFGATQVNVYEWTPSGIRLVSILPDGKPAIGYSYAGGGLPSIPYVYPGGHPISDDGRRIIFTRADNDPRNGLLYMREDGATTYQINASERTDCATNPGSCTGKPEIDPVHPNAVASFELAEAAHGSAAFFTSFEKLTDDATAGGAVSPNGLADLYRWNPDAPAGERLEDLTTQDSEGAGVLGTVGASADATKVYFVATGTLDTGAAPGSPNLYLWQQGAGVRFIATLSDSDLAVWSVDRRATEVLNPFREARVTPDGDTVAFTSAAALTSYDTAGFRQVYVYDATSGGIKCASCNLAAPQSTAEAVLKRKTVRSQPAIRLPRNLSENGQRLFFDTSQALVDKDTNGKIDVYEWDGGELKLLSSGASRFDSAFVDASSNGDNAFFTTSEQLVRRDQDELIDMYDARVGGGLPDTGPPVECREDSCQGGITPRPNFTAPGSELVQDRPKASPPKQPKVTVSKLSRSQRATLAAGGSSVLLVKVNRGSTIKAVGRATIKGKRRQVLHGSARLKKAGTARIRLKLSGPAQARLAASGKLRVTLTVSATGLAKNKNLTVELARARSASRASAAGPPYPAASDSRRGDDR